MPATSRPEVDMIIKRYALSIADYSGRFSSVSALVDVRLPRYQNAEVVVSAPEAGPGNWRAVRAAFW